MAAVIEEYPFIFLNTPSSLQLQASSEVALMLWRHEYSNSNDISLTWFLRRKFSCEEKLVVPIPSHIKAKIDERIVTIREELKKWIELFWRWDFTDDEDYRHYFSTCFNHIVIDACGAINFKATAVNILNSGDLNDSTNYQIACQFCLEEQIERFWPLVGEDLRFDDDISDSSDEYDLVFYWTRRRRRMNSSDDDSIHEDLPVELRLLQKSFSEGNWPAFEYFWKTLPEQERVSRVISFLKSGKDRAVIRLLLPKLNRIDAEKVFQVATSEIVHFLISSNDDNFQHVCQLMWTLMENTPVLDKESRFFDILRELWTMAFVPGKGLELNYARCDRLNLLLLEIWSRAEDELKDYVSNTYLGYFFDRLFACSASFFCCYGHDAVFLSDLLKRSRNFDKERFWRKNWRTLALLVKPSCLEHLMKSCLTNDDDEAVDLFRERMLLNSKILFELWIAKGLYSELNDYLKICLNVTDTECFQMLSKEILRLNFRIIRSYDDEKLLGFDWFVGQVFANVEKDIDEFKRKMIRINKY